MPKTIKVSGRITYGGANWPKEGQLYFACLEPAPGYDRRPGTALFNTSGSFTASSFGTGDGLVPGKYAVNIECWEVAPSMEQQATPGKSYVPEGFRLELDVPANSKPLSLTWDVPKRADL